MQSKIAGENAGAMSLGTALVVSALVLVLVILGLYLWSQSKMVGEDVGLTHNALPGARFDERVIPIMANGGRFNISSFSMKHFEPVSLIITPKDKDYVFQIASEGINFALKRGVATEVSLSSLGVGEHSFVCGSGCGGLISVAPEFDEETN